MYGIKDIKNDAEWQVAFDKLEMARRRRELVAWLEGKYEYYLSLAETAAWTDESQSDEYFEYARAIRRTAEWIATPGGVSDHRVNLMWLGEIEVELAY